MLKKLSKPTNKLIQKQTNQNCKQANQQTNKQSNKHPNTQSNIIDNYFLIQSNDTVYLQTKKKNIIKNSRNYTVITRQLQNRKTKFKQY